MKFLNKNCYAIVFGEKCNIKCNYCAYGLNKKTHIKDSYVEKNREYLLQTLEQLGDVLVMLSGGEPSLYEDMPFLLSSLPNVEWVILTNLKILPSWIFDEKIVLIIASYHEQVSKKVFYENLKILNGAGKRIHCKVICHPNDEYRDLDLFFDLMDNSIPVSFVPLEYNYYFRRNFLKDLITKYRTSALYNSRFFRKEGEFSRLCGAGTINGFQIFSDGSLGRCSHNQEKFGKLGDLSTVLKKANECQIGASCNCEWHHWNEWTLANDNKVWNRYIQEGVWDIPTIEELYLFIKKMGWSEGGRTLEDPEKSLFGSLL